MRYQSSSLWRERRNILKDLALSVGATFVSRQMGKKLKEVKLTDFGKAKRLEVGKNWTTILGGKGNSRVS